MNRRSLLGLALGAAALPVAAESAATPAPISFAKTVRYQHFTPEQREEMIAFVKAAMDGQRRFLVESMRRGRF